jgi:amino acid transporter
MNPAVILQIFALVCSTAAIIYYLLAIKSRHSVIYNTENLERSQASRLRLIGKILALIAIIALLVSYSIIFTQIRNGRHIDHDIKDIVHSALVLIPMALIELVVDELID